MSGATGRRGGPRALKVLVAAAPDEVARAGAGTVVRTVSEVTVQAATEVAPGGAAAGREFGRVAVDRELVLYLFGRLPGDDLASLRPLLAEGFLGCLFLVDGADATGWAAAASALASLEGIVSAPCLVAVTGAPPLDELEVALGAPDHLVLVDPGDRASVREALLGLCAAVLADVEGVAGRA